MLSMQNTTIVLVTFLVWSYEIICCCNCEKLREVSFFRTLQAVKNLQKKENKSDSAKVGAFQQLLLSIAIYLFKVRSLMNVSVV